MKEIEAPSAVRWITHTLEEAGFETWAVGGAVRDALLGYPYGDWDLATRAKPFEVQRLFDRTVPIGIDHGTVGVLTRGGELYEVTTFRRDVETTGRHAVVEFADDLDTDLSRRDFTINAVAWHPLTKDVHDPFDGRGDLKRSVLRTVGDPAARFSEDYLRLLRALRFAGSYDLTIEEPTWKALTEAVPQTVGLSAERLREELERVLASKKAPSQSLALYCASGVLGFLYPELDALVGSKRGPRGDWFAHSLRTVDLLHSGRPELRWAALFQGVGQPGDNGEGGGPVLEPEDRTVLRSAALMERLRSSNAMVRRVAALAGRVVPRPDADCSDEALRRWLSITGRHTLNSVLRIWISSLRADEAVGLDSERGGFLALCRRLRSISRAGVPLTVNELQLSGRELIAMGYAPGPRFGLVLEHLLNLVLKDPSLNEPGTLEAAARRFMEQAEERLPYGRGSRTDGGAAPEGAEGAADGAATTESDTQP